MKPYKTIRVSYSGSDHTCMYSFAEKDTDDGNVLSMFYSKKDSNWTPLVSGKIAGRLLNDGNGFLVQIEGKEIYLDYSQAEIFRLLLIEEQKLDGNETKTTAVSYKKESA
jgi:hypothetical protein